MSNVGLSSSSAVWMDSHHIDLANGRYHDLEHQNGTFDHWSAWKELGVLNNNVDGLILMFAARQRAAYRIDIGIGPPGQEVPIVDSLRISSWAQTRMCPFQLEFPIELPAGTRVAARAMYRVDTQADMHLGIGVMELVGEANYAPPITLARGYPRTIYAAGDIVQPGPEAGVRGAWTEMAGATFEDYSGLYLLLQDYGNTSAYVSCLLDVAMGPPGAEQILARGIAVYCHLGGGQWDRRSAYIPATVPKGSRLSVRSTPGGGGSEESDHRVICALLGIHR